MLQVGLTPNASQSPTARDEKNRRDNMNSFESSESDDKTFTVNLSTSNPSSSSTPVRNWESSFAKLVSSYGFGPAVPSLPDKKTTSGSSSKKAVTIPSPRSWFPKPQFKSSSASTPESENQEESKSTEAIQAVTGSGKNYEEAYAKLSSCYGFGGPAGSNHAGKK